MPHVIKDKHNIIFYGKVKSYFAQVFRQPLLLILGTTILALTQKYFNYGIGLFIVLWLVQWRLIAVIFPHMNPLYIFVGASPKLDKTELTIGFRRNKVSGILEGVTANDDFVTFRIQTKRGIEMLAIPATALPGGLLYRFKDAIFDITWKRFDELKLALEEQGYNCKIREGEEYYNLHAKALPGYLLIKLFASIVSLVICYFIASSAFM